MEVAITEVVLNSFIVPTLQKSFASAHLRDKTAESRVRKAVLSVIDVTGKPIRERWIRVDGD